MPRDNIVLRPRGKHAVLRESPFFHHNVDDVLSIYREEFYHPFPKTHSVHREELRHDILTLLHRHHNSVNPLSALQCEEVFQRY